MPGWTDYAGLLAEELNHQALEEGKDPTAVARLRDRAAAPNADPATLLEELIALPVRPGFGYDEPDALEAIRAARPSQSTPASEPPAVRDLFDRLHGAWLGRCVGCALGKPVEGHGLRGVDRGTTGLQGGAGPAPRHGLRPWRRLKRYLTAVGPEEWPLRDYFPENSPAADDPEIGAARCPASTREHIAFMETDDDIRYTVLGLALLREKGLGFSTWDVALGWINRLTYRDVCTAETQAYLNLVRRYEFHAGSDWGRREPEVDWTWVATHANPFREWIGAQIRIDAYAYAAAGNPPLAAELAWRDARLSHTKNGLYGAMFCAAMIAAAFTAPDMRTIVAAGLAEIPARCRLAEAIRQTIRLEEENRTQGGDFETLLDQVHEAFEGYSTVHALTNSALCAAALLHSRGDFHRGVTFAVMGGWDTDCNGATVGSALGAWNGARALPEHWTARLHDTLRSGILGYDPIAISACARQTQEVIEQTLR